MLYRRGVRAFDAVRVADPVDPIEVSIELPSVALHLADGGLDVASGTSRCIARPGQWVVLDRTSGALQAVDDTVFAGRYEAAS